MTKSIRTTGYLGFSASVGDTTYQVSRDPIVVPDDVAAQLAAIGAEIAPPIITIVDVYPPPAASPLSAVESARAAASAAADAAEAAAQLAVDAAASANAAGLTTDAAFANKLLDEASLTRDALEGVLADQPSVVAGAAALAQSDAGLARTDAVADQQLAYAGGAYPARTKAGPAKWIGPARPRFGPATDNDVWIQRKDGLLTEVASLAGLVGYWPLDDPAGAVARDVSATPANAAVSGAGAVFGEWNQPGGKRALGLKPKGSGLATIAAAAKLDVGDNFTIGTFFRRRNLRRGTLFQRGPSFFADFEGELFSNGSLDAPISTSSPVGNWQAVGLASDVTTDTAVKRSGTGSLKVHVTAANANQGVSQVRPSATPGRYRLQVWSRDDPANVYGRHHVQVSYTTAVGGLQRWLVGDGSFRTVSSEIEVPRRDGFGLYEIVFDLPELTGSGGNGLLVTVKRDALAGNGSAYDFWVDDVSLSKAVPAVIGTEQFTNTGFESALGASAVGAWFPLSGSRPGDVTLDTTVKRTGAQSVKVHIQADNGSNGIAQIIPSAQPDRYVFDFRSLDDPTVLTARKVIQVSYLAGGVQKWLNSAGQWVTSSAEIDLLTHDADWTFHRLVFDLPEVTMSGGNGLAVSVKRLSTSGGSNAWDFWVDDASLKRVGTAANAGMALMSNGDGSIALLAPDVTTGYKVVASTPPLVDHLGWHSVVATKAGAVTKLYIDGKDVTIPGTNVTYGTSPTMATSLLSGSMFGQLDSVAAHLFLANAAASPATVAAIVAEANMLPDRAANPESMLLGTNSYSITGASFDGARDKYAIALRNLGVTQSREVIPWGVVQPVNAATYDWSRLDDVVNNLIDQGISIMAVFDSWAPAWANGNNINSRNVPADVPVVKGLSVADAGATWATFRDRWVTFIVACVRRYKDRIHKWEILNEYNASLFCYPAASAPLYVNFYNTVRAAVLAEDPTAQLAVTSLARMRSEDGSTDAGSYTGDEWLRALLDLNVAPFDFIGGHPYMGENTGPRVHNVNGCSYDLMHQIHDTLVEYGRPNVKAPMNENGWYSGATKVAASSVGQTLPQATIAVDYTHDATDGTNRPWLPEATVGTPKTVYVLTSNGMQAVTYTGQTQTTLTGCTGGTGTIVYNAPVSVSPYAVSDRGLGDIVVDAIAVSRDYFSAWCDFVGFFSVRCYGGTALDVYNGSSWFYDFAMTKPKQVAQAFADAATPYKAQLNSPKAPTVVPPSLPRYDAVGGTWVRVAG